MNKKTLLASIITIILTSISITQVSAEEPQATALKEQVQRWGTATLTMTDDQGNTVTQTEQYPILDEETASSSDFKATAEEFKNCWDWCRKVCDGYGVCFIACGRSCSPWVP